MRKLVLTVAAVVAAFAAFAPSAFAETEAPVSPEHVTGASNEATGGACGSVTIENHTAASNCLLHANGAGVEMYGHSIFGETLAARCDNEFTGAVDDNGEGVIGLNQITFTDSTVGSSVDCSGSGAIRPCSPTEAASIGHSENWAATAYEDTSDGSLWMDISICLKNAAVVDDIAGDLWVRITGGNHPTGAEAEDHRLRNVEAASSDAEFDGHWSLESGSVELTH